MKKSPMEIDPVLSPMDIRFDRNKGCNISISPPPEKEALTKEGVSKEQEDVDYSLEPPIDEPEELKDTQQVAFENTQIEQDDITEEKSPDPAKTKLKSVRKKSRSRSPKE